VTIFTRLQSSDDKHTDDDADDGDDDDTAPAASNYGCHNEFFMVLRSVLRRILKNSDVLAVVRDLMGAPHNPFNSREEIKPFNDRYLNEESDSKGLRNHMKAMVHNALIHLTYCATGGLELPPDDRVQGWANPIQAMLQQVVSRARPMTGEMYHLRRKSIVIKALV
jgi:hypothetical protein